MHLLLCFLRGNIESNGIRKNGLTSLALWKLHLVVKHYNLVLTGANVSL